MIDPNRVIQQAESLLHRMTPESRARAQRRRQLMWQAVMRRIVRAALAVLGVAVVAGVIGFFTPIGPIGFFLTIVAMLALGTAILFWPSAEAAPAMVPPAGQPISKTDLAQLPLRTERWLEAQRPALPAPAQRLVDGLGLRLEALAPQLATLDPREPAAFEIRKLIGEELPELVDGYRRVPAALRSGTRGGMSPDKQLAEGLRVVDDELKRMTEQLARGDLNKLATQGRYLELKYRGDETLES